MKRKELLDNAQKSELYELIVTAEDAFDVAYTLDKILKFYEEAGMLPPDRMSSALSLTTKDWKIKGQQEFLSNHSWEPEKE